MDASQRVVEAIEASLRSDPENDDLRIHLARLVMDAGDPARALVHAATVLGKQPDHLEALTLAATAASAAGDQARAAGYRRLADALGGGQAPSPMSPPSPPPPPAPAPFVTPSPERTSASEVMTEPRILHLIDGQSAAGDGDLAEVEHPGVTLADVAGMEDVKRRLDVAFLGPMRNPELRSLYGKSLRGGLLLYGPPGCGKTFIARATAGELEARFMAIGLPDVLDPHLGQSERNLRDFFTTARRRSPCVVFLDEVDALGQRRSQLRASAARNVVAALLEELDSVSRSNEGLFILAATNHPWDVDTALRRPGRFDRMLLVLPPDRVAREAIIRNQLDGRPVEGIDAAALAGQTEHFSGADLAHLCETAAEFALADALASGTPRPITMGDLDLARREIRPSTGGWFQIARNHALFANQDGTYDDLLAYLDRHRLR